MDGSWKTRQYHWTSLFAKVYKHTFECEIDFQVVNTLIHYKNCAYDEHMCSLHHPPALTNKGSPKLGQDLSLERYKLLPVESIEVCFFLGRKRKAEVLSLMGKEREGGWRQFLCLRDWCSKICVVEYRNILRKKGGEEERARGRSERMEEDNPSLFPPHRYTIWLHPTV